MRKVRLFEVDRLLKREYGSPARRKKQDPIDELIRTVLSQNTSDKNSYWAFDNLKAHFRIHEELKGAKSATIERLIRSGGLAGIKSRRIKGILNEIYQDRGRLSLDFLRHKTKEEALSYLRSLKGVGPKTAACVLLFSFGMPVMPVDTHILRVSKRLGILKKDITAEEAHERFAQLLPQGAGFIYRFHINLIEHGRKVCHAGMPECPRCALKKVCNYYQVANVTNKACLTARQAMLKV